MLKYKLHHLLFWLLVLGTWYYLRKDDYRGDYGMAFRISLVKTADLALMVYITNYLLLPRLFYVKKYAAFAFVFIVMILLSSYVKMQVIGAIMKRPDLFSLSGNLKARIYDNVIPHFFLVLAGAAVKVMYDYSRMQRRMTELAKEKAEAELNFLKSQINPHFLFNSLNSVYFLIDKKNPEARNALHKFSEMLRYQLYEVNGSKIPVEKEISYLRDYIDLQKLRLNGETKVEFITGQNVKNFAIEPLLLIPFVENAFKHLSYHPGRENFIQIRLQKEAGRFTFLVSNTKEENPINPQPGGIGQANVKRRLELLYPGQHDLQISDTKELYTVQLTINTGV